MEKYIQETEDWSKSEKEDSIPNIKIKIAPPFKNKEEYINITTKKKLASGNVSSETDGCVRNLRKEHENDEDKECIETTPEINDSIK